MPAGRRPTVKPGNPDVPAERLIFASNFREARKAACLSQQAVSGQTGYTQGFISDVERGKSSINLDGAAILANLVNVPLWKLLKPD